MSNRCLYGSHQDVGVFFIVNCNLADHDGGWSDLDVAIENCEDLRVTLGLVSDHVGDCESDGTVEFTDDYFGLGCGPRLGGLYECFTRPHDDSSGFA